MVPDGSTRIDSDRGRFDVATRVIGTNDDGTVKVELEPHPARYEWRDVGAARELYDRSTGISFPEDVVRDLLRQMQNHPAHGPPPSPDPNTLLRERAEAIRATLVGTDPQATGDPSHDALAALVGQPVGFAVVSVDLVGSTRLQAHDPEAYDRIVPLLGQELGAVGAAFGGLVINFTGDGALLGFPGPIFCVGADAAFDAATAVVADVYYVLNPLLEQAGLPPVDVRVGLDSNDATVHIVGDASNRRRAEVLGIAVSMAAKVQGRAKPREILVGQSLHGLLHVSRQDLLEPDATPGNWPFVGRDGESYGLFRMAVVPPADDPRWQTYKPAD